MSHHERHAIQHRQRFLVDGKPDPRWKVTNRSTLYGCCRINLLGGRSRAYHRHHSATDAAQAHIPATCRRMLRCVWIPTPKVMAALFADSARMTWCSCSSPTPLPLRRRCRHSHCRLLHLLEPQRSCPRLGPEVDHVHTAIIPRKPSQQPPNPRVDRCPFCSICI